MPDAGMRHMAVRQEGVADEAYARIEAAFEVAKTQVE